jgi:hypothetical protein
MMREQPMIHEQGRTEAGAVDDSLFVEVAKPIAHRFAVSGTAMRIRLEKVGLLLREEPHQMLLDG